MRAASAWLMRSAVVLAWASWLATAAPTAVAAADTVYACVPQGAGSVRFVTKSTRCKRGEQKWSWSAGESAGLGSIHGRLVSGCSESQPGDPELDSMEGFTVSVPGRAYLLRSAADGAFHFDVVKPGRYKLVAEKNGRAPLNLGTVTVRAGEATTLSPSVVACTVACGDGQLANSEQCDDGNTDDGDGCSSTCETESVCGDGQVDNGEACDDADLAGQSCEGLGFVGGTLACSQTCQFSIDACDPDDGNPCTVDSISNGNVVHAPLPVDTPAGNCQVCDGNGQVMADPACQATCGNGVIEGGEDCDGADLGGQGCSNVGFSGGTLSCTGGCVFNTSACTP